MNISTKLLKAAAGQAGGAGLDVDEVFSTFLYDGNNSSNTISNNIDLSGEGGLVWIKSRSGSAYHTLFDTARGVNKGLFSNATDAELSASYNQTFTSSGFTLNNTFSAVNDVNANYVSWTFRKAKRFMDIQTWTGDGTSGRSISHSLNSPVGFIAIKALDSVSGSSGNGSWMCCARKSDGSYAVGDGTSSQSSYGFGFNLTNQSYDTTSSSNAATHITSTAFSIQYVTGSGSGTQFLGNTNGVDYVAYIFAHNDNDGGFGPDGDQDIIKCGSLTTDSNGLATVNLGFEPQWLMIKRATTTGDWQIVDNLRGFVNNSSGGDAVLKPNSSDAESSFTHSTPTATGFLIDGNVSNHTIIYMAIRRGPLAAPEDATKVFALGTRGASTPGFTSNFPVDMFIRRYTTGSGYPDIGSRLTGAKAMQTSENFAEGNDSSSTFDHMNGYYNSSSADSNHFSYMWKRAPSYFDCVCYSGTGSARTVPHGLTVPAEMIWVKSRSDAYDWVVYHKDLGTAKHISLNRTNASAPDNSGEYWGGTTPTDSVFSLGTYFRVNGSAKTFIAYLFATAPGVSKVGSYTGNAGASTINVDCGFSSGARFVLIKESSGTGDWWVFDTVRGLVAGNDAALKLNTTDAESSFDYIDPYSGGFSLQTNSGINTNGATFIFYAIA